ncbi:MAG: hypothetical protein L6R42_006195 [Xanthoria sp. 1 TBL-2021]|nr:MAG: hypothetical protein L6R42_006195 [Xanthoria sp. 1 TBL-2021]
MANTTHHAGCAYNANQKNLLSVAFWLGAPDSALPDRSCDSKTQSETNKAPTGDVFQVVEIRGEEEDGDDEDEDAVIACQIGVR